MALEGPLCALPFMPHSSAQVLMIQGFLAARKHADRILLLVEMMQSEWCPAEPTRSQGQRVWMQARLVHFCRPLAATPAQSLLRRHESTRPLSPAAVCSSSWPLQTAAARASRAAWPRCRACASASTWRCPSRRRVLRAAREAVGGRGGHWRVLQQGMDAAQGMEGDPSPTAHPEQLLRWLSKGCPSPQSEAASRKLLGSQHSALQVVEVVLGLISSSLDAWRTRQYGELPGCCRRPPAQAAARCTCVN